MPTFFSSLGIVVVGLLGSALLAAVVSTNIDAGWSIWYHPAIASLPVIACLAGGIGTNWLLDIAIRQSGHTWLTSPFALLVRVLLVSCVFWIFVSTPIFTGAVSMSPEINTEAEHLFFIGWYEMGTQNVVSSALLLVAIFAYRMRSDIRYWVPVVIIGGAYGVWGLADSFWTLAASLA